jgi:hypothetical protein
VCAGDRGRRPSSRRRSRPRTPPVFISFVYVVACRLFAFVPAARSQRPLEGTRSSSCCVTSCRSCGGRRNQQRADPSARPATAGSRQRNRSRADGDPSSAAVQAARPPRWPTPRIRRRPDDRVCAPQRVCRCRPTRRTARQRGREQSEPGETKAVRTRRRASMETRGRGLLINVRAMVVSSRAPRDISG